jgi:hypothetical protein
VLGVIANSSDEYVVREFFELFKTPWEFYRSDRQYDVVLCTGQAALDGISAKLLLVYAGKKVTFDETHRVQIHARTQGAQLAFSATTIPLYGSALRFLSHENGVAEDRDSGEPLAYWAPLGSGSYARVGYDLFQEVRTILVDGQPTANASSPTLELHIAFLRYLIAGCGLPLVEIPPAPEGHPFIVCLTHDLDHASIRRHKFDATMFGFLYRATLASTLNAARGRLSPRKLLTNWTAAAKLPLVYLGLAADFWYEFDRYLDLEKGRPSTFFIIPFAGRPGRSREGDAPSARGSGYDVSHIGSKIQRLQAAGCEIGLHGIDAWIDSTKGREEADRIGEVCARRPSGVRMHWLYGDEKSSGVLEEAEFNYDSSVGYNQTVGYRAGTSQVFKPLGAKRLLELPMHIMDTALFYPDYLNLSDEEAWTCLRPLLDNASRDGGALTINWHDRSIAPERLWGNFYVRLMEELSRRGALFCTAAQAVSWFQKRRSVVFERSGGDGQLCASVPTGNESGTPNLRLRFHKPRPFYGAEVFEENYTETVLDGRVEFRLGSQIPGNSPG